MNAQRLTVTPLSEELGKAVNGTVIVPGDAGYDRARQVFSGNIDRRPAVIVRPTDAPCVARVVRIARERELELAVRSGGHSGAGHSTTDGGVVLDLRDMKAIDVGFEGRTVWAEAGLTAAEYSAAVGAHGLATGFGDTGSVGIGGITLGGGVGYLARKFGLTIDSLLAAEIVTANGEQLYVDADTLPDLFWAIRGGGGNFGVVTRFRYQLQPVDRVLGGMLLLPATPQVIESFMSEADQAPDELTSIVNVMPAPPMPFVPSEHHGKLVLMALMCYTGDLAEGERVLAPFRALAQPLADVVRRIPYPQIYPPDDESFHPTTVSRTMFIDHVDGTVARATIDHLNSSDAPVRVAQFRVLGGALARVAPDATAFAHRNKRIMVNVAAFYRGSHDRGAREQWVAKLVAALHQRDDDAYVNFVGDEGPARVRASYPGRTWERLGAIKAKYDPTNLFRLNQNIEPCVAPAKN